MMKFTKIEQTPENKLKAYIEGQEEPRELLKDEVEEIMKQTLQETFLMNLAFGHKFIDFFGNGNKISLLSPLDNYSEYYDIITRVAFAMTGVMAKKGVDILNAFYEKEIAEQEKSASTSVNKLTAEEEAEVNARIRQASLEMGTGPLSL